MPFYDTAAQNAALDALWGAGHGASMPSTFEVGLLNGDPSDQGVELASDGGYARVTCANDASVWLAANEGLKSSNVIRFAPPSDAWSDDATHWGIYVAGVLFDYGPLDTALVVEAAAPDGPQVVLARYFDTTSTIDTEEGSS